MKNKQKLTAPSLYEETLLWMSYRYAIGRMTIAAYCHAKDIAQNEYKRYIEFCPNRAEFIAKDINSEIEMQLRFGDFYINFMNINNANLYNPLHIYYEFINFLNIENLDELKKIKKVNVDLDRETNELTFDVKYFENDEKTYFSDKSDDLDVWQKLSCLFNKSLHVMKKLDDGTEIECFESYTKYIDDNNKIKYKKILISVDEYISNPTIYRYYVEDGN